jgi:hypothetical protein
MKDNAYGLPMDSGGWFRWVHFVRVAEEVVPAHIWPISGRFTLQSFCALCSIGDEIKQRFQFAVLLHKAEPQRRIKSRFERFGVVYAIRAMAGHTENDWLKTPRYAVRLTPEDALWMSVLSHNTYV